MLIICLFLDNQLDFMVNFLRLIICSVYTHPNPFEAKFGNFLKQVHTFDWYLFLIMLII